MDAVAVQLRMAGQDLLCPCGVLLQGFGVLLGRHPGHQHICQIEQLLLQAAGKDCQTHDLDQADVLLFDVVELCVGMVDPQRVFRGGDVVAQDQIQLISAIPHPGNGGDGVVGFAVRLGKDEACLVGIAAPCGQDLVGQLHQTLVIRTGQADAAHGPVDDAGFHILKAGEYPALLDGGLGHGELVVTALEVVVAQDAAAHNGQVCIAAHEIVGEQAHEVQQLAEGGTLDLHGGVLAVEHDAVLVVVDIGAVLQIPCAAVDGQRDDAVVFAGGMVHPACIALVLHAELALGVGALGGQLGGGNGLGILFGLREVDGDIQIAVGGLGDPLHVPLDAVAADVIGILAEFIEPVGGGLGALFLVPLLKVGADNGGARGQHTHQLGVKQVAGGGIVLAHAPGHGIVHQRFQDALEVGVADISLGLGKAVQLHGHQQLIADVDLVIGQDEPGVQPIVDELLNGSRDHSTAPPSGRMERMWHLPAPRMASISALKASSFFSGTKACTVPAKPPP